MLFSAFNAFGIKGIIVLKAFILTACLFLVYIRAISLGSNPFYALLVMFIVGMTALDFTGERPQLFAFLFAI